METQPNPLPPDDEDWQKWQRIFAKNNQNNQVLIAEAIQLLEERTPPRDTAKSH